MTTLEAVNTVLSSIGYAEVSALETGTNSGAGQAESALTRQSRKLQAEGWHFNKRFNVTLSPDDNDHILIYASVTASLANPTVITQTGHGLASGDVVEFRDSTTTPSLTGPYVITKVNADTYTVPVNVSTGGTAIVSNIIGGTVIEIDVDPDQSDAGSNISMQEDRLYDLEDNTDEFDGDLKVWYKLLMPFAKLPPYIQELVVADAAVVMNDNNGVPARAAALRDAARLARVRARQADTRTADTNVLETRDVRAVLGNRMDIEQYYGGA